MPNIKITAKEYAAKRGITPQAVSLGLRYRKMGKNYALPGVRKITPYGRFYVLTVEVDKDGKVVA